MSEAKTASKAPRGDRELALATLELFELLITQLRNPTSEALEALGDWADEWKPRLERIIRNGTTRAPSSQQE